jgi:hypothetical protein
MSTLLNKSPLYMPDPRPITATVTDKGEQIMKGLLLSQYQNSPDLQEYMMAFIAELDLLFAQTEEVYKGRFIETAVGAQQDVIGEILQQPRSVILPKVFFGFAGTPNVEGMSDEATPAMGGIFKDENIGSGDITALDDITYRRVLLAISAVLNRDTDGLPLAYFVISILLNRVPSVFELRDADSGIPAIAKRQVDLLISANEISAQEKALILYMTKYFVPAGITFTITEV